MAPATHRAARRIGSPVRGAGLSLPSQAAVLSAALRTLAMSGLAAAASMPATPACLVASRGPLGNSRAKLRGAVFARISGALVATIGEPAP